MEKANDAHLQQEKFSRFDNASKSWATAVLASEVCPSMSVIGFFRILLHVLDALERNHRNISECGVLAAKT
jgi:hypothetical protein